MNSVERVLCALRRDEPDRLPILELDIEESVMQKIMPGASRLDFFEKFDVDGVFVEEDIDFQDTSLGSYIKRDHFGILRDFREMAGSLAWPFPVEPLIGRDVEDLDAALDNLTIPDPHDPKLLASLRGAIDRLKGKKLVIFDMLSSFVYPSFIRGFSNLLLDYHENPEFARRLTQMIVDYYVELEKQAIEYGVDAINDSEDYCGNTGPYMSPEHFKEFVLPGLQQVIDVAKVRGIPFIKHSDGNIWALLDMIVDAGIDAFQAVEPAAGMDIGEVKKAYGDRIALIGNVDCAQLLTFGTPDDVRRATLECIRKASPGGGHILSSSNIIHKGVPPENYLAMIETAKEYGKYPIKL